MKLTSMGFGEVLIFKGKLLIHGLIVIGSESAIDNSLANHQINVFLIYHPYRLLVPRLVVIPSEDPSICA